MNLVALLLLLLSLFAISSDAKKGDMDSYRKRTGKKYLEETAKKEGVLKLKSGMLIEVLKESTDPNSKSPTAYDSCDVTYSGTLKDGTPFDAGTTSFSPSQVIKGWTEAMQLMGEGDKWKVQSEQHAQTQTNIHSIAYLYGLHCVSV